MMHLVTLSRKIATKKQPYAYRKAVCGAPSGTRTQDPLIKSQLLYLVTNSNGVEVLSYKISDILYKVTITEHFWMLQIL